MDDLIGIPGIGPKKRGLLQAMGINYTKDLTSFYPSKFKNYRTTSNVSEITVDDPVLIKVKVDKKRFAYSKKGASYIILSCHDSTGRLDIVFFNSHYLNKIIREGNTYCFYGKASFWNKRVKMANPEFVNNDDIGKIVPLYRTISGLSQKDLRKAVEFALDNCTNTYEFLPDSIIRKYGFPCARKAVRQMHFPSNRKGYSLSRRKLIYEEFFLLQMTILSMKKESIETRSTPRMKSYCHRHDDTVEKLPFRLTKSQNDALDSMSSILQDKRRTNILLLGDVGTGKTLVALLAVRQACKSGYQSALMAPTELLAEQHMKTFNELFNGWGMNAMLLTGNSKNRELIDSSLRNGNCDLVIGTHAVIQDGIEFKKLGLIITDERHRFGVTQQKALLGKGFYPQVIVMSATPIPRTITEIIFGDMEIVRLHEKPNRGTAPVETRLVSEKADRIKMYRHMKDEILAGHQIFYVCPRIEEGDSSMISVEEAFSILTKTVFPNARITMLHGRMPAEDKNRVMQSFREGDIDIIVSTTVIEVGIDIPNATIMVIDSFERFGLAQIHQLRGRVGRGSTNSYCYLVARKKDNHVYEKAKILQECTDGFRLAKADMKIRGPGHVFSLKQHGFPEFKLADMFKHYDILVEAQKDIESLYSGGIENLRLTGPLKAAVDSYRKEIEKSNF